MNDLKNHEWCTAYPHAAADEIKRLETLLNNANEDKVHLSMEVARLQDAVRDCAETATSVAEALCNVTRMLKEKGL
jgi:hypothetical protein